jgi:hypothetical protein
MMGMSANGISADALWGVIGPWNSIGDKSTAKTSKNEALV